MLPVVAVFTLYHTGKRINSLNVQNLKKPLILKEEVETYNRINGSKLEIFWSYPWVKETIQNKLSVK